MGLHPADITVLVFYLVGITALGVWMSRRVKDTSDFFMPRRFGPLSMIMHAFGSGTASDQAVTVASGTAQNGLSGIWYQWLWLIPTPFYWLVAPIMRRFRAVTTGDVLTLRFGQSVAVLFALVGIVSMSVKIGVILKGAASVVESGTGGSLDPNVAIFGITVLFLIYGIAGGLSAAIVTDFIQGILTIVFSVLLLPFVMSAAGGMSGIREAIGADSSLLSLVTPGKITGFFVAMFGLQALIGIVSQPHIMGVCAAGKTETEGRVGFLVGNLVKRLCTVAWCLTGIAAVAWYLDQGITMSEIQTEDFANRIYGDVAHSFLPKIAPGLLGVFLASLLAAVMSSCDSFMISSAGLFVENVYKPMVKGKSTKHYLFVSRITSLAVVVGGVLFAFFADNVVSALEIWFKISPMTGIVFWMCLFWRRMTVAGAWATTLSGFAAWWLATRQFFITWVAELPLAEPLRLIWGTGDDRVIYDPWQVVFYLTSAVVAGVIVSLLTTRVEQERVDRFHDLIRTPIQPNEVINEPCTLPTELVIPKRPVFIKNAQFEIPKPSKTSVVGFVAGVAGCLLLVLIFIGYARFA